jgi:hypothetical protein
LTIGADFKSGVVNGKKVKQRVCWSEDSLIFFRHLEESNAEMVMTRTIEQNASEYQILLKIVHRDFKTGKEVEGMSWFNLIGPSTTSRPLAEDVPLPFDSNSATIETGEKTVETLLKDLIDDEEDDDEIAVRKMRMVSSARQTDFTSKRLLADLQSPITSILKNSQDVRSLSTDKIRSSLFDEPDVVIVQSKPDLSGIWKRSSGTFDNVSTNSSVAVSTLTFTHIISMTLNQIRIQEFGGTLKMEDSTYTIDSQEYIKTTYMKKLYRSRCYWEGETLVMHRINVSDSYELLIKRDLEEKGTIIRLVSIYRNVVTGEEAESMSIFNESSRDSVSLSSPSKK